MFIIFFRNTIGAPFYKPPENDLPKLSAPHGIPSSPSSWLVGWLVGWEPTEELQEMIDEADRDGDGEVNEARKVFIGSTYPGTTHRAGWEDPSFEG